MGTCSRVGIAWWRACSSDLRRAFASLSCLVLDLERTHISPPSKLSLETSPPPCPAFTSNYETGPVGFGRVRIPAEGAALNPETLHAKPETRGLHAALNPEILHAKPETRGQVWGIAWWRACALDFRRLFASLS